MTIITPQIKVFYFKKKHNREYRTTFPITGRRYSVGCKEDLGKLDPPMSEEGLLLLNLLNESLADSHVVFYMHDNKLDVYNNGGADWNEVQAIIQECFEEVFPGIPLVDLDAPKKKFWEFWK